MAYEKKVKPVVEPVVETEAPKAKELDIQEIIKQAVAQALAETTKKYEEKISVMEEELKQAKESPVVSSDEISPSAKIKITHMCNSSAPFKKGKVNVLFQKLFDQKTIRYDVLEEMFTEYPEWFTSYQIVVEDKKAREALGLEENYYKQGANKARFVEILKMPNTELVAAVEALDPLVAYGFLKYFLDEYMTGNSACFVPHKFNKVEEFYNAKYSVGSLQEIITDLSTQE